MSKLSKERIQKHLENLVEQISVLKEFQSEKLESFVNDKKKCYAVYHAFLLAVQNVMDIGGHILSAKFNIAYDEYKQIIPELADQKVISQNLAQKCKGIAEFRNKLVHGYLEIKPRIVFDYLKKDVPILETFSKEIVKFLDKI